MTAVAGNLRSEIIARYQAYWFRNGGLLAISISRILLFIVVYRHAFLRDANPLLNGAEAYYATVSLAAYNPKSLVQFFSAPPPAWFVDYVIITARWSTLAAIVGLFTRFSMVASILSVTFLLSLTFSWEPYWSHGSNVVMLAGLAMMFGRAGDYLSVDYLIKRFGLRLPENRLFRDGSYWWPVLLAQWAVALFYFAGFFAKFTGEDWHWSLAWVFSDNLRNSLLRPYMIYDREVPWHVMMVASYPLLWKLVAAGHLANQALPVLAVLSTRKPWIRLTEGIIFAAGAPLLGAFMGIWNLYWMLLATFFVDWDYFIGRLRKRFGSAPSRLEMNPYGKDSNATNQLADRYRRVALAYVTAFLIFDIATFLFRLSPIHKMYPFSWMGFYSAVEARAPYNVHQPYTILNGQLLLHRNGEVQDIVSMWQLTSLYLPAFSNKPEIEARLSAIQSVKGLLAPFENRSYDMNGRNFDVGGWNRIDLNAALIQVPAYPKDPKRTIGHAALVATYDRTSDTARAAGGEVGLDAKSGHTAIRVASAGFKKPQFDIWYRPDPWANPDVQPLAQVPGEWSGDRFIVDDGKLNLPKASWTPLVIRVREEGETEAFDFFGPILYR